MDINKLFKCLPKDLQWEILTIFVGTHIVRCNKLMRRMDGHIQDILTERTRNSYFMDYKRLYLKQNACYYGDGKYPWFWTHHKNPSFRTITQVILGTKGDVFSLLKNIHTGELSYGLYSSTRNWYISPITDSVTLSPYVRHIYPSYPYTDKKLKRKNTHTKMYLY